jgi:hypothetical protein
MTNLRRDFFFLWIILRYPLETLCGCHSRRPNSSRTFFSGRVYFFQLSCPDRANDNWSIPVDGSVLTRIIFGFAAIDVDFQLAATEDIDELFYFYYWKKKEDRSVGRIGCNWRWSVPCGGTWGGLCSVLLWAVDTSATAAAQHSTVQRGWLPFSVLIHELTSKQQFDKRLAHGALHDIWT